MAAILYRELFYGKARRVLYKRDGGRFTPTVAEVNRFVDEFKGDKRAFELKRFEEKLATFNLGRNLFAFVESNVKGSPIRGDEYVKTDYVVWIDRQGSRFLPFRRQRFGIDSIRDNHLTRWRIAG